MIPCDHAIREPCDIMREFPSSQEIILPNFAAIELAEKELFCF